MVCAHAAQAPQALVSCPLAPEISIGWWCIALHAVLLVWQQGLLVQRHHPLLNLLHVDLQLVSHLSEVPPLDPVFGRPTCAPAPKLKAELKELYWYLTVSVSVNSISQSD